MKMSRPPGGSVAVFGLRFHFHVCLVSILKTTRRLVFPAETVFMKMVLGDEGRFLKCCYEMLIICASLKSPIYSEANI